MGMFYRTLDFISRCFFKVLILVDAIVFHTYVCYNNGKKLVQFLIRGTRTWVIMAARLLMFTLLLAPGWYKLLRYWFLSPLIIRNLRYGKGAKNRNLLDVYLPVPQKRSKSKTNNNDYNNSFSRKNGAPVVIFVSGGAWTIGYKMWSALVARGLARLGILTIVPDYRNFPQGDIEDMMEDIRLSVEWTVCNAHRFGGDSNKIVLSGQSAGAHITLCLLVSDYLRSQMQQAESMSKKNDAERFLTATDDSGSDIYEEDDDSESEVNDNEEGELLSEMDHLDAGTAVAFNPQSESLLDVEVEPLVLEHPTVGLSAEGNNETAETTAASPLTSLCSPNTVEYFTPLKTGTSTSSRVSKRNFSPRATTFQTTSAKANSSSAGARSGVSMVNISGSSGSSSDKVRRHSTRQQHSQSAAADDITVAAFSPGSGAISRKRAHSSGSIVIASDSKYSSHKHSCGGSIIDIIDTYLGANISSKNQSGKNNNHDGPGVQLLSATAASLKKKFREQLRRNSAPGEDVLGRFDSESSSSSSYEEEPRSTPLWKDVDSDSSPAVAGPQRSPRYGGNSTSAASTSKSISAKSMRAQVPGRSPCLVQQGASASSTPTVSPAATSADTSPRSSSQASELVPSALLPGAIAVNDANSEEFASPPVAPQFSSSAGATLLQMNRHYSPRRVSASNKHSQNKIQRRREVKMKAKFCVASNIKLFIGVSGPYNLTALESHLHQRGLDVSILNWICRGNIGNYSPTTQLAQYAEYLVKLAREQQQQQQDGEELNQRQGQGRGVFSGTAAAAPHSASNPSAALSNFTPIALFHGSRDASIPVSICTELSEVLQSHGANVLCKIYEGWSHTDAILEAPLSGTMRLFHDMAGVIFAHTADCSSNLGSLNSISGLSGPVDKLVFPPSPLPHENDTYTSSPLDYLSITLFPKLFSGSSCCSSSGSTVASSAGETAQAAVCPAGTVAGSSTTAAPVLVQSEDEYRGTHKKVKRKPSTASSSKSGRGDAMVSQLLVKIAREINPF